jgi:Spy/CpxP family protein refolding chaperone
VEVKKLVLELAKKRETIKTEMRAKRENGLKPSDEERFANQSQMLDEKIAMKTAFKKILTPEQMAKFEENLANRSEKMQARRINKSKKFANKK